MKIAIFTDTYDEVNGVANAFQRLIEYALTNNKEIELFTHSTKTTSVERLNKKVKIHRIKVKVPIQLHNDLHFDLIWFDKYLLTYFKENKFDLIHTATPGSMGLNALFLAKMFKIPLIGSYHTHLPEYVASRVSHFLQRVKWLEKRTSQSLEQLTWNYMKAYYNRCNLILTLSETTKKELVKRLKPKIEIFPTGVDAQQFNPRYRTKYFKKWYDVKTAALYVGRLVPEKNLDLLVEVFKNLPEVKLFIIGDGPYRRELEEKIDAEFLGYKKGVILSKFYANCDFFVFPSITDALGVVVLEAMASELPVIVTNKGGPQELVKDGSTGFIVNPTEKEFSEKVKILTYSGRIRKKMGKKARDLALKHDWNTIFTDLFKIYEKERAHSLAVMKEIP